LNGNIYLVRYGHYLLIRSIHPLPIHSMSWADRSMCSVCFSLAYTSKQLICIDKLVKNLDFEMTVIASGSSGAERGSDNPHTCKLSY